mgnify:FL=1
MTEWLLAHATLSNHGFNIIRKNEKDCWACVAKIESHEANEIAEEAKSLMQKFQ